MGIQYINSIYLVAVSGNNNVTCVAVMNDTTHKFEESA